MAHRTRKKLTKTELKKDPVNEALLKGMGYIQEHVKQLVITGAIIILGVLVIQSLTSNSDRQANEARAQFFLATQLYNMGIENLIRYGDVEVAVSQLQTAQQIARNNFRSYPGRLSGKRSMILAAKIGLLFRMENEVITELQDFLASDPGGELETSARLHLAIALENRGGGADYDVARELYNSILDEAPENSQIAWEAYSGLSRIAYGLDDYNGALENLQAALEIFPDTTEYVEYQLARLEAAMN
ncbi:MAG: tetratricopeptide repeat protein [Candidatus Fermentibacteraceae bacterium]|nr:tetratricopeptide repeat protein [Candidatus Fermentibacteraceae bacterium]